MDLPNDGIRLRGERREGALKDITSCAAHVGWSHALLKLLLEELCVDDEIDTLLGNIDRLAIDQFPQAIAVALALRHSWRADDFLRFARRLQTIAARSSRGRMNAAGSRKRMLA